MGSRLGEREKVDRQNDRLLITTYYGNAIRQNKTCLSDMRKAVWAVYFHIRSSDEEPLHSFCPVGPNSWCKYQNQVVEGSVETFRHSNKLPVAVMDAIKPVFNDLSQPKLLQKCLGGKTQNNNESINSLIWKLCPKTLGCGRKIVDISTNEAIVIFNDGNQGRLKIMQSLGLTVGQFAHKFVTLVDIKRIQTAEVHFNLRTKKVLQTKRMQFKNYFPILFNIFINDLPGLLASDGLTNKALFADDLTIWCSTPKRDQSKLNTILNLTLERLHLWCIENNMTVNLKKTTCQFFTLNRQPFSPQLVYNGMPVQQSDVSIYLGCALDNKLKWTKHAELVVSKTRKRLSIL
ncbi:uncharacterized protein TNCV_4742941 [Trichonephila clavipes]|nr:uncharacterized protein TNCV_4742941 [Trichonephila clavipes]